MSLGAKKSLRYCLLGIYLALTALVSTVLLFVVFEVSESVRVKLELNHAIRYYKFKHRYVPDSELVFIPRYSATTFEWDTKGDLYSPDFNIDVETVKSTWTYTRDGFRANSSSDPYDILVIGDSFIEVGESDTDTLSELISEKTGLATFNLGRGWYGPYQYLSLLRRYGNTIRPSCVLFSFFSGNDLSEMNEYKKWLSSGWYYDWPPMSRSFMERYINVVQDVVALVEQRFIELRQRLRRPEASAENSLHPSLGIVRVGEDDVVMAFGYRHAGLPPEQAMASDEWTTLKSIIAEFRDVAMHNDIATIVVFIPTKLEVYAPFVSKSSGAELLADVEAARGREFASAETLRRILAELDIPFINLLPEFRARAKKGEVLYYPFDSHWNSAGRVAGAEIIADALKNSATCW